MSIGRRLAVVAVLSAAGCTAEQSTTGPGYPLRGSVQAVPNADGTIQVAGQRYIPVGTTVPIGQSIVAPPEPFDPRRHAHVPNALVSSDIAHKPGVVLPPRFRAGIVAGGGAGPQLSAPSPGNGDFGLSLQRYTKQWYGVYEVNDVGLDMVLPPRATGQGTGYVYAPTMLATGYSCIEVATVHRRNAGTAPADSTEHLQGWFDWCQSGPAGAWSSLYPINQAYRNQYVRDYYGKPTLTVSITTPTSGTNHCWYSDIYDFVQGGWAQIFTSCPSPTSYSPGGANGWTFWEAWYVTQTPACPSLANVRALNIQLADPTTGSWVPITQTNDVNVTGTTTCWTTFGGSPYIFTYPGGSLGLPANSWHAATTAAPVATLSGKASVRSGATCLWSASVVGGVAPFTYAWSVNGSSVNNNSLNPYELIYHNTGTAFTVSLVVTDAANTTGSKSKNVAISGSAPICTY